MTKTTKLFAVVAAVAIVLGLVFAPVAKAQTTDIAALNAMIAQLQAQIAQLSGSTVSTPAGYVYSTDLTVGSRGADVSALQAKLGVTPATGYFGAITKAAVQAYQATKGISATGYVGPLTRAALNVAAPVVVTPGTPTTPVVTTSGEEGSLDINDTLSVDSSIEEGDEDVQVLGLEVEAKDSDIVISRIDVDFKATTVATGASDRLTRYIDSVALVLDGKTIDTMDASEADEDSDVYSFRFTGLSGVVKADEVAELFVEVTAVENVDGDDEGTTWTVAIPVSGIRAVDGAGISDTYSKVAGSQTDLEGTVETFDVAGLSGEDLVVSEATSNPDAQSIEVDESDDTTDVTALVFKLKANDGDMVVNEIPVVIATTSGATSTITGMFKKVYLYDGSDLLDSVTIASANASGEVLFEDLDLSIDEDDTVTLTVKVDLNDTDDATFANGDAAEVSVGVSNDFDVENVQGDVVSVSGSANGETMTFYVNGISVKEVSTSVVASNDSETVFGNEYTIKFSVTSFGEDAYILKGATTTATSTGVQFAIVNPISGSTVSSDLSSDADLTGGSYLVQEGQTETFTLKVTVENGATSSTNYVGVKLAEVNFSDAVTSAATSYVAGLNDIDTEVSRLK
ncbi:MAG: peptidoglycan-binding domain-containing protein [Candidatus Paceibacterota bacterium]|jgi:hypothetical protein